MDDKEYYSLMNRPSSYQLQQFIKNQQNKAKEKETHKISVSVNYRDLAVRQGAADAEMLAEKDPHFQE